jgi:hypothetical protein
MSDGDDLLFAQALALPAVERAAFLAAACGDDAARRAGLEAMLAADAGAAADDFMASPLLHRRVAVEGPGVRIGRYVLAEKIGEGGCGVVFRAEQLEPVRREVALKIIKLGMDTAAVVARFEAERQALALMEHPGIARVLDAGATETGRPYFVMELVRGVRLTEFCEREDLSREERLRLFVLVCRAVQHAHQKGVIHRDLKPSNLLVARHDGMAVPKVIDFGIAKATAGRLTDATLLTGVGHAIGTPAYMSPEQADGASEDIDTRSDIYALGVVLYEVLTGRLPFATPGATASAEQVRRAIREREAPRPSSRVEGPAAVALRGDLDWIVLRCLEAERARRYESAAALASDIERHLAHEPVSAAAPGKAYVIGKFYRRHRFAVLTGGVIAALVVGGLVATTWSWLGERAMLERARTAEQRTVEAYRAALKQQAQAPLRAAEILETLAETYAAQGDAARADRLRADARELRKK